MDGSGLPRTRTSHILPAISFEMFPQLSTPFGIALILQTYQKLLRATQRREKIARVVQSFRHEGVCKDF
jgi:hypothetical protein